MDHRSDNLPSLKIPAAIGAGEAVGVDDRRRFPRVPYRATIEIHPYASDSAAIVVVLQDLSATGMGVIHSCALCVGQRYHVPLMRGEINEPSSVLCTVVRCEQLDDDLFSIGFEFDVRAEAQPS